MIRAVCSDRNCSLASPFHKRLPSPPAGRPAPVRGTPPEKKEIYCIGAHPSRVLRVNWGTCVGESVIIQIEPRPWGWTHRRQSGLRRLQEIRKNKMFPLNRIRWGQEVRRRWGSRDGLELLLLLHPPCLYRILSATKNPFHEKKIQTRARLW